MPHYANGSEVKVGDYVKGKPHNSPHEITGVVVYYQPNQEKCNIHVAHARPFQKGDHHLGVGDRTVHVRVDPNMSGSGVTIDVGYGQAEDFEPLPATLYVKNQE